MFLHLKLIIVAACIIDSSYSRKISRSSRQVSNSQGDTAVVDFNDTEDTGTRAFKPEDYENVGETTNCGMNTVNAEDITRAQAANRTDWPWMAGILRRSDLFHFCGGVIVTTRHILTASHCFPGQIGANFIIVRLGEYDFNRYNDSIYIDMDVEEIRLHEDYDMASYENDIAILKLKQSIGYGAYVQPICMPQLGSDYVDAKAIVIGWGTLFYGGPKSDILMEVPVPVWKQEDCSSRFTQTIFDTNLCAAGYEGGKDSCQGDSGGPLLYQKPNKRWESIGIVSWGVKCARKGKPGIYTRVNMYLPWIKQRIQDV